MRIALSLEYQGTQYSGWQKQKTHAQTVQHYVEKALSKVADSPIEVVCAGRTDAGVHASGQVIHFDTTAKRTERAWVLGANTHLPSDIRITAAQAVSETFHARYGAVSRTYHYLIANQTIPPVFMRPYVTWILKPLNVEAMQEAAQYWVGEHDFSSFRAKNCQAKHPNRCIHSIQLIQKGALIQMRIEGNAFLYHMVRNMMGTLLEIGLSEKPISWANEVLLARSRAVAGETAPASGLTLTHVAYAPYHQLSLKTGFGLVENLLQ